MAQLPPSSPYPSPAETRNPLESARKKPRSRLGCWTCRQKKVKCDEQRPQCQRCRRLDRRCDYDPRPRKKYVRHHRAKTLEIEIAEETDPAQQAPSSGAEGLEDYTDTIAATEPFLNLPVREFGAGHEDRDGAELSDLPWQEQPSLPSPQQSLSDACCSILSPGDEEAIHSFRFVFSASVDTKVPEHSVPAIVWALAEKNPMVLHMVCALGARELCYHRPLAPDVDAWLQQSSGHYGAGLRLLAEATQDIDEAPDLDYILGTLWLMIAYEQKFGDGCGMGIATHLKGAASIVQGKLRNLKLILNGKESGSVQDSDDRVCLQASPEEETWLISRFSSRMLVWISFLDGAAALNGLGGTFCQLLGHITAGLGDDPALSLLRGLGAIHRHSNFVHREIWGDLYPQTQVLEDLENRQLFYLYGETGQLRYMLAQMAGVTDCGDADSNRYVQSVTRALRDVAERYSELFEVASMLDLPRSDGRSKFVTNIRFVVPFYHTIVLCFLRIVRKDAPLNSRQRAALREIMTLAYRAYSDEGNQAITRVAWPLFVAVLESDDPVHRAWILERYQSLDGQGENYRRANQALRIAFSEQRLHERRVDVTQLVRRADLDRFVI